MELKRLHIITYCLVAVLSVVMTGCRQSLDRLMARGDSDSGRGEYFEAAKKYRLVYSKADRKDRRRGEAAWRMSKCYDRLNMSARAETQLRNTLRNGLDTDSVHLLLARNLLRQGKYKDAHSEVTLIAGTSPLVREAELIERSANEGMRKSDDQARYRVSRMKIFTTTRSEYAPMMYPGDDGRVYFTSTSDYSMGEKSGVTGMKNGDIVMSRKNEQGQWLRAVPTDGDVNTAADEGTPAFTPDGRMMYFTRADGGNGRDMKISIWRSRRLDGEWSEPVKVIIDNDTLHNYAHPAISADGRWLIFSSNRCGGRGGYDLWRVSAEHPDRKPQNLGPAVNTAGDEKFPTISPDGRLWFASDGHPGLGGLDIYQAGDGAILPTDAPENAGQPINSASDDFGITFLTDCSGGFFSSNRGDVSGHDHIFRFEAIEFKTFFQATVIDFDGRPLPEARLRIVGDDGSDRRMITGADGMSTIEVDRGVSYAVMASARAYLNAHTTFEIPAGSPEEETEIYEAEFVLAPVNREVKIDNVFFDYDRAELKAESYESLDRLVVILNDNPEARVEMTSHTDRHGSDAYNMDLSQRRARAVTDYLESKGIENHRLSARGLGRTKPTVVDDVTASRYVELKAGTVLDENFVSGLPDETAAVADGLNRRTEFKIVMPETTE